MGTKAKKTTVKKAAKSAVTKASPAKEDSSASAGDLSASIEACKSWNAFKTRAAKVEKVLKASGYNVSINSTKPGKGNFVVTLTSGSKSKKIIELIGMPRPFTKLKALDVEDEAEKGLASM